MSKHSTLVGGSNADRFINCIGSCALIKIAPKKKVGDAAHIGTALHSVMEWVLDEDPGSADDFLKSLIGEEVVLDEKNESGEDIAILITEDYINKKIKPSLMFFDEFINPEEFWLEEKVSFDGELSGAHGTADVLYQGVDEDGVKYAGIVDWKFGDNHKVRADNNTQLKFYLSAALKLGWFGEGVDIFEATIVQPIEGLEIDSYTLFSRESLLDFEKQLLDAKIKKDSGDDTLTIGDHCTFCPAKVICPEWLNRGKKALESLQKIEDISTKKISKTKIVKSELKDYDHKKLSDMYLEAKAMQYWISAIDSFVKNEFNEGRNIDNLKKVVSKKSKSWADEKKAENWIRRQGFKAAEYRKPVELKTPAQIEKMTGPIKEGLVIEKPYSFSIVSIDDPRDAIENSDLSDTSALLAKSLTKSEK